MVFFSSIFDIVLISEIFFTTFFFFLYLFVDTIKQCLQHLELYGYVLRENEKTMMIGLNKILDIFNIFTKFVQSTKYCTMSYMLLFYEEIRDKLQTQINSNIGVLRQCAQLLLKELPQRFEISDEVIVSAIIDPWSQHLRLIDEKLNEKGITKLSFLTDFCEKNNVSTVISSDSNVNNNIAAGSSSNNSVLRILLEKHINTNTMSNSNSLQYEISEFEKLHLDLDSDFNNVSILNFWKANEKRFPIMAKIAQKVLFITTSNAQSESAFSSSGCLINQKRASLNPLKAEKILLIYNNIWLTEQN